MLEQGVPWLSQVLCEESVSLPCSESAPSIWCHLCLVTGSQSLCAAFGAYGFIEVALAVVRLLRKGLPVSPNALCIAGANCYFG